MKGYHQAGYQETGLPNSLVYTRSFVTPKVVYAEGNLYQFEKKFELTSIQGQVICIKP